MTGSGRGADDPWARILDRDEIILWQGKPREAFYWRNDYYYGVIGAGAGLFFVMSSGTGSTTKLILLLLLPVFAFATPVWDGIRRHYSFFTLTDRRGIVGLDMPVVGRHLNSHRFGGAAELFVDHSGSSSAVYFAKRSWRGRHGREERKIGFEGLTPDEADEVHRLIRETLKGTT